MRENIELQQNKPFFLYVVFIVGIITLSCGNVAEAEGTLQLQVMVKDYESVLLQWESDSAVDIFQIQRAVNGDESYRVLATLSGQLGTVQCYDNNVEMGEEYIYKVVQISGENVIRESECVAQKVTLAAPVKLKTKIIKDSRIKVSWQKVNKAISYTVYRSNKSNKGYKRITTVKDNSYIDYDVEKGKSYYYKVTANHKKKVYTSAKSDEKSVHMKPAAPSVVGSYAKRKIKLTWKKVKGADTYYVYKKKKNGKYEKIKETGKLYYCDYDVKKGKTYTYEVVAVSKVDGKQITGKVSEPCIVLAATIDPKKKMVALTYDDGPGKYTEDILKCLKDNQSKATFYVIGCNVDSYKDALKKADKMECEIGNHTYNHPNLAKQSNEVIQKEMIDTDATIKKVIGHDTVTMRPPGGSISKEVERVVDKPVILWSIDTRDWEHRNSRRTIKTVMNNVQDGDIILMHDIYEATRDASIVIIPQLRRQGYQLVTVSELAQYRGYTWEKGKVYRNFRKKALQ